MRSKVSKGRSRAQAARPGKAKVAGGRTKAPSATRTAKAVAGSKATKATKGSKETKTIKASKTTHAGKVAKKPGKAAGPKLKQRPFDLLLDHVTRAPAVPLAPRLAIDDPALLPVLAVAAADPRVKALVETVVRSHTSFHLHDFLIFPRMFLRGKSGEPWNRGAAVVGPRDVCLAATGAGDLYVWSADTGKARLLERDRGWDARSDYADIDELVEEALHAEIENAEPGHFAKADAGYLARFQLALRIAGDDMLDDEVRAAIEARA